MVISNSNYDEVFFEYVNSGALRSARRIVPILLQCLQINSILDVGCGQGAWLSVWKEMGVKTIFGLDGDYVNRDRLLIQPDCFQAQDLSFDFDLGRKYDLVQSLEVAEHLPSCRARSFVCSLVKHAEIVLFSAAVKGQGGDHHINEQSYEYWRKLFREQGYYAIDLVRELIRDYNEIEPWYRYNMIMYASRVGFSSLSDAVQAKAIPEGKQLPDVSPLLYRLRKLLLSTLSVPATTNLAKWKERATVRKLASRTKK